MTSPSTRVEIVKLERIPPGISILGTYEVEADERGNVLSLSRFRRVGRPPRPSEVDGAEAGGR